MNQEKKRGRPAKVKNVTYVPSLIDFSNIAPLNKLDIDSKMLEVMKSGLPIDELLSEEGGLPCASNYMMIGDPGVGKTTVLLDLLASVQNKGRKCLFISGEMGRKQMFKYTERFKQFGIIQTLFMADYMKFNTKDTIEQVLNMGWDCVLIDSAAEIIDGVREEKGMDKKTSEGWFVYIITNNNKGENEFVKYSSFLSKTQVTKAGEFVGSNKLKHLFDAMGEMRRESEKNGGATYITFSKNRNGNAGIKFSYQLNTDSIYYGKVVKDDEEDNEEAE